jgi:hypothetical protein
MAKSSIEYAELSGLKIALGNLEVVDVTYRDEDWIAVTEWMKERIKQLSNK